MAIRSTAILQDLRLMAVPQPCAGRQEKREAVSAARRFASLLGRMEAPRYDVAEAFGDAEAETSPEVVLVFVNEPPIELGTPAFESLPPAGYLRACSETEPFGIPMAPDPDQGGMLSPVLNPEDCALAAFRRLMADVAEYGPSQTWQVAVWNETQGRYESRLYHGTESALRRNFPDAYEATRMEAAGVLGVPNWVPAPGQHGPAYAQFVADDHEAPAVPYRMRRHTK